MRSLIGSLALIAILAGGGYIAYKFCPPVHDFIVSAQSGS
jgi:hypothetical protein